MSFTRAIILTAAPPVKAGTTNSTGMVGSHAEAGAAAASATAAAARRALLIMSPSAGVPLRAPRWRPCCDRCGGFEVDRGLDFKKGALGLPASLPPPTKKPPRRGKY